MLSIPAELKSKGQLSSQGGPIDHIGSVKLQPPPMLCTHIPIPLLFSTTVFLMPVHRMDSSSTLHCPMFSLITVLLIYTLASCRKVPSM